MSALRLPRIEVAVTFEDADTPTLPLTLDQSSLTSSTAPHRLAVAQMTMSYLYAYIDVLKHLSGIATEGAAREIRMEEKRSDK